jgi:hypothetical protein
MKRNLAMGLLKFVKTLPLGLLLFVSAFPISAETTSKDALTINEKGNTYVNRLLGVSVEKPANWYAQNVKEMIMSQQRGSQTLAGDDQNMQAMLDAAAKSSLPLFGFYEYPPGTPGKINPNVLSTAENIQMFPGIKDPCDYITAVQNILKQGQLKYSFDSNCKHGKISDHESGYLDASLTLGKLEIYQRYYAVIKDGYAISFIQTYTDDANHEKVNRVINSIKITR